MKDMMKDILVYAKGVLIKTPQVWLNTFLLY